MDVSSGDLDIFVEAFDCGVEGSPTGSFVAHFFDEGLEGGEALVGVPVADGHFPTVKALNWPVKWMYIAAGTSHYSRCLMV